MAWTIAPLCVFSVIVKKCYWKPAPLNIFWKKLILLFCRDALIWYKVRVKLLECYKRFLLQIHFVLLNCLFIKESWNEKRFTVFTKILGSTTISNITGISNMYMVLRQALPPFLLKWALFYNAILTKVRILSIKIFVYIFFWSEVILHQVMEELLYNQSYVQTKWKSQTCVTSIIVSLISITESSSCYNCSGLWQDWQERCHRQSVCGLEQHRHRAPSLVRYAGQPEETHRAVARAEAGRGNWCPAGSSEKIEQPKPKPQPHPLPLKPTRVVLFTQCV